MHVCMYVCTRYAIYVVGIRLTCDYVCMYVCMHACVCIHSFIHRYVLAMRL